MQLALVAQNRIDGTRIGSAIDILQVLRHAMLSTKANVGDRPVAEFSFGASKTTREPVSWPMRAISWKTGEWTSSREVVVAHVGHFDPTYSRNRIMAKALERAGAIVVTVTANTLSWAERHVSRGGSRVCGSTAALVGFPGHAEVPVARLMAASNLCLGVFCTSGKAHRIIPNKVFDAVAVARPVATGDTPAAREVLTHGQTAWLCALGSADGIARAITEAKADEGLRRRIAEQGHAQFSWCFSIDSLARDVAGVVLEALGRSASEAIRRPAGDEAS
jgi:hypothetical protein